MSSINLFHLHGRYIAYCFSNTIVLQRVYLFIPLFSDGGILFHAIIAAQLSFTLNVILPSYITTGFIVGRSLYTVECNRNDLSLRYALSFVAFTPLLFSLEPPLLLFSLFGVLLLQAVIAHTIAKQSRTAKKRFIFIPPCIVY